MASSFRVVAEEMQLHTWLVAKQHYLGVMVSLLSEFSIGHTISVSNFLIRSNR
jgi:hypothetical protein